jgi:hypothetical protein
VARAEKAEKSQSGFNENRLIGREKEACLILRQAQDDGLFGSECDKAK